jgi:predicted carbohydrate-binding protein with CBM5 and CBM33 domain
VRIRRRTAFLAATLLLPTAFLLAVVDAGPASAHGAMMVPGSRTFFCWEDGLDSTGQIVPQNPACQQAVDVSGANSLYNWFAVLRSDGAGRTVGFVPDGQLCSGGNPNYAGFDNTNANWPVTHLTSGASMEFRYNKWAAHPGSFILYVTKDGWDPTVPLRWDELESTPFYTADHPPDTGPVGSVNGYYFWTANLPANKTGRHIIYSVWKRSDSNETFYGCSDVMFDGGTGQVTGIGQTGSQPTVPCDASYTVTNTWSGGLQAQVTITNPNTTSTHTWSVNWIVPSGVTVSSSWNGTFTQSGDLATMRNANWNGVLAPNASASFGMVLSSGSAIPAPSLTCAAT